MGISRGSAVRNACVLLCLLTYGWCVGCLEALAEVRVYVEPIGGKAWIRYQCTAGEIVRAFPLDVTVDQGRVLSVSDFFRGPSTESAQGYGIFPAAFRDHIELGSSTNINWAADGYSPLAVVSDDPGGTLAGLGSSGVTLEFAALWDPAKPAARPARHGTLCVLEISQGANVSVVANESRGGVVATDPDIILAPVFVPAFVQPPEITGVSFTNDSLTITFEGGELETAPGVAGPWSATGNHSGQYTESVSFSSNTFFRVSSLPIHGLGEL